MQVEPTNEDIPSRRSRRRRQTVTESFAMAADWDHLFLAQQGVGLYRSVAWIAATYAILGTGFMVYAHHGHVLAFALIAGMSWACLDLWQRFGRRGVPVLPVLVASWDVLNSLPLLTNNATLEGVPDSIVNASAWTVVLLLLALTVCWFIGVNSVQSRPSVWNIVEGSELSDGGGLFLSLPLMGLALAYHVILLTGLIYKVLPGSLGGLMSVFTAFAGAVASLGALLGGMTVARRPFTAGAILFWALFTGLFFLLTSGILLSGANALVIACAVGLGFGLRRIPWGFLVTAFLLVGFLNQGKFVMRDRYWNEDSDSVQLSLGGLPQFYEEWFQASSGMLINNFDADTAPVHFEEKEGESLVDRLDNFQNLTYIVNLLESGNVQTLHGKTYTIIPGLLIPRFLWPDKPRTHEGQIMLNLNFGRQASEEATFKTYVAWGLLPEAVGNFGCIWGAILLGLVAGFASGWLEAWSGRKRLLSVEGLVATSLLVQVGVSYEMVASVFVTSTFQMLVAVITVTLVLRAYFLNSAQPVRRRRAGSDAPQDAPASISAGNP